MSWGSLRECPVAGGRDEEKGVGMLFCTSLGPKISSANNWTRADCIPL